MYNDGSWRYCKSRRKISWQVSYPHYPHCPQLYLSTMWIKLWISFCAWLFIFLIVCAMMFEQIEIEMGEKMKYAFLCQDITDTVVLAGEFIDKYMTKANGEFVKVYLYLLYHAKEDVTSADIANALNILESDAERAVAYWLSEGALRERQDEIPMTFMLKELKQEEPEKAQVACAMRNDIADSEDFSELMYAAQKYMGIVFSQKDYSTFTYLYETLGISYSLIEYVLEEAVSKNKKSVRYVEKVLLRMHNDGIRTVEQAKESSLLYQEEIFGVMRIFGLGNRNPGSEELRYIRRWFDEYKFSKEMVFEACKKTMKKMHGPNFDYTEGTLKNWMKDDVRTLAQVEARDEQHGKEKKVQKFQRAPVARGNFVQRKDDIDMAALQKVAAKFGQGAEAWH